MVAAPRKAAESGRRTASSMRAGDIHCAIGLHTNNTFLSKASANQGLSGSKRYDKEAEDEWSNFHRGGGYVDSLPPGGIRKKGGMRFSLVSSAWSPYLEFEIDDSLGNSYLWGSICGAVHPHAAVVRHWQYSLDAIYPCLSFPHTGQIPLLIPIFLLPVI